MSLAAAVVAAALCAAPAVAAPTIHAHRGGPVLDGVPTFPEETMPAFRHAASQPGWVLELDVKLTRDRVPVVFHDPTVDRMTPCTGTVSSFTAADLLARCKTDVLGTSPDAGLPTAPTAPTIPIPTLAEFLAFARESRAPINLEIKNNPGESDFDQTSGFANTVMDVVLASGVPASQMIVQSYWPPNLDVARSRMPGVQTSLLTFREYSSVPVTTNEGAGAFAAARGYEWVSPQWPVTQSTVASARAAGRRIVPYTLNRAEQIREAAALGLDAVITDDPAMARRALGGAGPTGGGPSGRTCRSRRVVVIRVRRPAPRRIRSVRARVDRGRVTVRRRGRGVPRVRVDLRGEPAGRARVRILVVRSDGRRVVLRRAFRTCTPRR